MASSWDDVRATQAYLDASPEKRIAIHQDYFHQVVAPNAKASGMNVNDIYKDYIANTDIHPYYNHETNDNMNVTQWNDAEWEQIKDASKGLYAAGKKALGMDYNKQDYEEGRRYAASKSGTETRTMAAIDASLLAPEAVGGALGTVGIGAEAIGEVAPAFYKTARYGQVALENAASSSAYQAVDSGSINPERVAIDTGIGLGLEGVIQGAEYIRRNPNVEAEAKIVSPGYKDYAAEDNFYMRKAKIEDQIHSAYQIKTLADIMEQTQKAGISTNAGEVLKAWSENAPEMHKDFMESLDSTTHTVPDELDITQSNSPLQQVVEQIVGKDIPASTTIDELAAMVETYSVKDLRDAQSVAEKVNARTQKELNKDLKKFGRLGSHKDLYRTHRLVNDYSAGHLQDRIFAPDINSISPDMLNEMGIGKGSRFASYASGILENASLVNRTSREWQANRIADRFGKDITDKLKSSLESQIEKADIATGEYRATEKGNTLSSIAKNEVARARSDAMNYGVQNLEDLSSQISLVREGKQIKEDLFNNAMYNAQLRKFVRLQDREAVTTAEELKNTARQVRLMSKTASSGKPWKQSVTNSTVGYLIADELADNIVGSLISSAAAGAAIGYTTKRAIDGAIHNAMVEADKLLSGDIRMPTGDTFKESVDESLGKWEREFEEENGRQPHESESQDAAEIIIRLKLKELRTGKEFNEFIKSELSTKSALGSNLLTSLTNSKDNQN